jgi:hypothetical protein
MQPKPIFVGMAAGILLLVVAAASFFSGLYVGQRGYVAGLQSQPGQQASVGNPLPSAPGAGQPPQSGFAPAGGPPGAPYWPPERMGRFLSLTGNTLTLDSPQGQVTVTVTASTRYTDEAGHPLTSADLTAGNVIAAFGADTATLIMRLPPR